MPMALAQVLELILEAEEPTLGAAHELTLN